MMSKKKMLWALCVFFLFTAFSFSQSHTGNITGVILYEDGSPISGVGVVISSPQLIAPEVVQTTNMKGFFRFAYLPPGKHTLKANLQGYEPVVQEGVVVNLGMVTDINIRIKPSDERQLLFPFPLPHQRILPYTLNGLK